MISIHIHTSDFNLRHTLEAGQCFAWIPYKKGYAGVIDETFIYIYQRDDVLYVKARKKDPIPDQSIPVEKAQLTKILRRYFSLDVPYREILDTISVDPFISKAIAEYHGLRVVKQPHFDCFISFLLSANTTVANTKMARFLIAKNFGKQIFSDSSSGDIFYSLPSITIMQSLSELDLRTCKTGFRAEYIHEAMKHISYKDLDNLEHMSYENAKTYLMHYKGIGHKIADCILIYSYNFENIYPTDTWVKQFTQKLYFPDKKVSEEEIRTFGLEYFNGYAGWAQLFLYMQAREKGKRVWYNS